MIDGKDISHCLLIEADNVTIKDSRIRCDGDGAGAGTMLVQFGTAYVSQTNLTMSDVEISRPPGSQSDANYAVLLYGTNVTMTRVDIHDVTSGIHFSADDATLTDSYIHDLVNISGEDHNDAVISNGGADHITLEHNTLSNPLTEVTPIAMYPQGSPNTYWTIHGNYLAGGGFCIYPSYTKGSEQPNNHVVVTDNTFSSSIWDNCGYYGAVNPGSNGAHFADGAGNVWTDNVWDVTGKAVPAS